MATVLIYKIKRMNTSNQVLITRIYIFVELFNSEHFEQRKTNWTQPNSEIGRISYLSYMMLAARQSTLNLLFVKTLASTWHCWDFATL